MHISKANEISEINSGVRSLHKEKKEFIMKTIYLFAFSLLSTLFTTPVIAQEEGLHDSYEFQQVVSRLLFHIEEAADLEHKHSKAISDLNKEEREFLYKYLEDKEKFFQSAYKTLERFESAKSTPADEKLGVQDATPVITATPTAIQPYTPNYPPSYSAAYNIANVLGLTSSREERCDGVGLEIYEDAYYALEQAAYLADQVCNVAGCDPSGAVCFAVCGTIEVVKGVVNLLGVLKLPLDACKKHGEGVDSAEIEAGYENSVSIIGQLNQQETKLNEVEAKLNEIIELLKTPSGRRPNWNQ